jgi:hypothetical protein
VAKELGETSLMFLVHPRLTEEAIEHTCRVIETVVALGTQPKGATSPSPAAVSAAPASR